VVVVVVVVVVIGVPQSISCLAGPSIAIKGSGARGAVVLERGG